MHEQQPFALLTDAWGTSLAAVVQQTHICQAIAVVHSAASLQNLWVRSACKAKKGGIKDISLLPARSEDVG